MNRLSRPTALKIAAVITVVISLIELVLYQLPDLLRGQAAVDLASANGSGPPFFLVLIQFAIDIIGIVAAYGAWRSQRWGVVLLIVLSAVRIVPGLLGSLFAPNPATRVYAVVGVILDVLIVVLCLWRERKVQNRAPQAS